MPDDDIDKISHRNAMACFSFDPFRAPAEGAVHVRVRCEPRRADVDIEIKSMGRRKADADAGALAARLAAVASKGAPAATG